MVAPDYLPPGSDYKENFKKLMIACLELFSNKLFIGCFDVTARAIQDKLDQFVDVAKAHDSSPTEIDLPGMSDFQESHLQDRERFSRGMRERDLP